MKKAIEQRIEAHVGGKSIKVARYAKKIEWQGKDLFTIAQMEEQSNSTACPSSLRYSRGFIVILAAFSCGPRISFLAARPWPARTDAPARCRVAATLPQAT